MLALRHLWLRRRVHAYLDGELGPSEVARVRAHVRECWLCSGELELFRLVRAALRHMEARPR